MRTPNLKIEPFKILKIEHIDSSKHRDIILMKSLLDQVTFILIPNGT